LSLIPSTLQSFEIEGIDFEFKFPARWYPLAYHDEQEKLWCTETRFRVVPAGRRSGKTEIAKRFIVIQAMTSLQSDAWFVCAAPVNDQAVRIYWADLKAMSPAWAVADISEGKHTITYVNGAQLTVLGLDKPERIEGRPLDGIVLDEYANMKSKVWIENVRPALSTPGRVPGWAWFIGVPEGRNHYYKLSKAAEDEAREDWSNHHWTSRGIVDESELESAKGDLDELTYAQEYEASFINFSGRAYYTFNSAIHAVERLTYNPNLPIHLNFDFNVSPGICSISQESLYTGSIEKVDKSKPITKFIGEVWIPRNSNTPMVCRKALTLTFEDAYGNKHKLEDHLGDVVCYGDATGGAKGTAKVKGSDWDLIKAELRPVFGSRLKIRVPKANPRERVRINSMNARFMSHTGAICALVDPRCKHSIEDLDGTALVEGGSGELDKNSDSDRTHMTDGMGYNIVKRHPIRTGIANFEESVL